MKKTNDLRFCAFMGFIGFLGARGSGHPEWAYLSLLSFGSFLVFIPTLDLSKARSVPHPKRKWFLLSLLSLFFLFSLFTSKSGLSGLAFLSFLTFFAGTKPSQQQQEHTATDVEPHAAPLPSEGAPSEGR